MESREGSNANYTAPVKPSIDPAKPSLDEEARRGAQRVKAAVAGEARAAGHELGRSAAEVKRGAAARGERIAGCVDRLAREFDDEDERWLADVAHSVSGKIARLSHHVNNNSFDELTEEVRSLSKHPIAFLGGAFAIGLVAGRFLKSSAPESTSGSGYYSNSLARPPAAR